MKKFKVGDQVMWSSKSWGETKTKVGTIVAIVPECCIARCFAPEGMTMRFHGMPRKHESYLVKLPNSKVLSWPKVDYLKKSNIPSNLCSKSCIEALNKKVLYKKAVTLTSELFNLLTSDVEQSTLKNIINDCKDNIYALKQDKKQKDD
jgi:hypothetical protein